MRKRPKVRHWSISNPTQLVLWREARDINGREFAQETGIDRTTLCQIERRRRVAPEKVKSVILKFCGVDAHEFFDVKTGLAV